MTTTPNRTTEIASYLAAVERHLNDLPTHIRQDLMSELDTHLSEVAADLEPGASLRDLLGSPEAYARELRDTAEVDKEPVAVRVRRTVSEAAAPITGRLRTWADKYAVSTGHADAAELRDRLRPGWWVLRGALAALLLLWIFAVTQFNASGYNPFGSPLGTVVAVAVVLLGVWASMRIGARSQSWGRRKRWWTGAAGIALVAYAVYAFAWPFAGLVQLGAADLASEDAAGSYIDESYDSGITDVYVYDENGNLLTGVYLFDQNGNPLLLGDPYACPITSGNPFESASPVEGHEGDDYVGDAVESADENYGYQYPLCVPKDADDMTMPPSESASPSESPSPSESESPTSGETPTPGESASPTPGETPTK